MPNYYNPYNFYPVGYANQMGYAGMQTPQAMPGQSYAAQPGAQQPKIMEWVEGEVGAKAYQMPAGWPANQPIPLWDSTDTIIWLKSWGPMGIPNPMQKLRYEMPEQQQSQALLNGGNSQSGAAAPDMSQYVTRNEMEQMKEELKNVLSSQQNGGYSGNVQNLNYSGNSGGNPNRGGLEGYRISGNDNQGNQNGSGNSMNRGGQ